MVRGIASAEEIEYWNHWIEESEENRLKANSAITDMVGFQFKGPELPYVDHQWFRLWSATSGKSDRFKSRSGSNENTLKWVFRIAAVLLLVGLAGMGAYLFSEENGSMPQLEQLTEERTILTEQGEQKTLQFSNGSKVILNSNSSLTYRLGTSAKSTIEVTLEGEAWFDADPNHQSSEPAFEIVTPDGIIRDVGTKFLVTVENGLSRIILQEGLVEVEPLSQFESLPAGEQIKFQIQKGEMVEFNRSEIITRKSVNPTFYSSWATGVLVLTESSVQEFAEYVENRFDVNVDIRDNSLEEMSLNGTVYFRSLDELMRSVSEVIGIPVYRSASRDTVLIGN